MFWLAVALKSDALVSFLKIVLKPFIVIFTVEFTVELCYHVVNQDNLIPAVVHRSILEQLVCVLFVNICICVILFL